MGGVINTIKEAPKDIGDFFSTLVTHAAQGENVPSPPDTGEWDKYLQDYGKVTGQIYRHGQEIQKSREAEDKARSRGVQYASEETGIKLDLLKKIQKGIEDLGAIDWGAPDAKAKSEAIRNQIDLAREGLYGGRFGVVQRPMALAKGVSGKDIIASRGSDSVDGEGKPIMAGETYNSYGTPDNPIFVLAGAGKPTKAVALEEAVRELKHPSGVDPSKLEVDRIIVDTAKNQATPSTHYIVAADAEGNQVAVALPSKGTPSPLKPPPQIKTGMDSPGKVKAIATQQKVVDDLGAAVSTLKDAMARATAAERQGNGRNAGLADYDMVGTFMQVVFPKGLRTSPQLQKEYLGALSLADRISKIAQTAIHGSQLVPSQRQEILAAAESALKARQKELADMRTPRPESSDTTAPQPAGSKMPLFTPHPGQE